MRGNWDALGGGATTQLGGGKAAPDRSGRSACGGTRSARLRSPYVFAQSQQFPFGINPAELTVFCDILLGGVPGVEKD
jgi:hypothetical protein